MAVVVLATVVGAVGIEAGLVAIDGKIDEETVEGSKLVGADIVVGMAVDSIGSIVVEEIAFSVVPTDEMMSESLVFAAFSCSMVEIIFT